MSPTINSLELQVLFEEQDPHIIDVREAEEFASGHIPGASNLPLSQFPSGLDKLDKNTQYHLICNSGARSGLLCDILNQNGFDTVNIMGGMDYWQGDIVNARQAENY